MAVALSGAPAEAQDLTAGRTPAQLFVSGCSACHKSPQGLAKGQSGGALSGFLRQHYTSKPEMADALAGYLASAGNAPAPGGRAGRAAAQEPPGAPGAPGAPGTQPSGRARAAIAVPAAGVPGEAAVERGPHGAKRQPATAARPGAKPADGPEAAASAAPARGGPPSIITNERGRAGAGQAEAGRMPPGSRRHRDAGVGPDAPGHADPGHADRVTNLHGAPAPNAPAPSAPAATPPAETPPAAVPAGPTAEPNSSTPDAGTSVANAPPVNTAPVSSPSEPPKSSMDTPVANTTPPESPEPTAGTAPTAAPESSPRSIGSFSRKPNVDKDATAVAEEKSAVRSGPPVRMRSGQPRGAAAGNAATARRPSLDSPN